MDLGVTAWSKIPVHQGPSQRPDEIDYRIQHIRTWFDSPPNTVFHECLGWGGRGLALRYRYHTSQPGVGTPNMDYVLKVTKLDERDADHDPFDIYEENKWMKVSGYKSFIHS